MEEKLREYMRFSVVRSNGTEEDYQITMAGKRWVKACVRVDGGRWREIEGKRSGFEELLQKSKGVAHA